MIKITSQPFGSLSDGREIVRYTMENDNRMQVGIISYACAIQSILVPDKEGGLRDVVLGYDKAEHYEKGNCFFGAFIGRYANRIKNASFSLNGKTYALEKNEGRNHLHGTFSHRIFDGVIKDNSVVFPFTSPPSEEGFPGTLTGELRYRLTDDNALEIVYTASSDEDTVINLTNHSYFNLNGEDGDVILNHTLRLDADRFTEVNEEKLPTGRSIDVDGTPFDFRREKMIGSDILCGDPDPGCASGYDYNYILNGEPGKLREFAEAKSAQTGIVMTALTTEPGVQFYTGNLVHEDTAPCGKGGLHYPRFGGFCLEAQRYPGFTDQPGFPSSVLRKGEIYRQKTVYRFSVGKITDR